MISRPAEIAEYHALTNVRHVLVGILGLVMLVVLAFGLVASIRRRRHEIAVLESLGFSRRQVRATLRWQAAFIALVALVAGASIGAVVGRIAWRLFAERIGVVVESPPLGPAVAVVVAVTALVAGLAGLAAGHAAVHRRVAAELRDE